MDSADELLVHQTRLSSFGMDTSRLYERADGKKPWRAECVVLDEHKAAAKDVCMEFAARWQLTKLNLRDNHLEHIAYLQAALEQAGPILDFGIYTSFGPQAAVQAAASFDRAGMLLMGCDVVWAGSL